MTPPMFEPNAQGLLSLAITFVLPLLVGLLSKQSWSSTVKALILMALSFVKSFLEAWLIAGADFNLTLMLYSMLVNFAIAVASYFGLLKGTPLAEAAQRTGIKDRY